MRIDSILNTLNNPIFNKNNRKQLKQNNYNSEPIAVMAKYPVPFLGTPRVDKRLPRFADFNGQQQRLTTTLKAYLETLGDKLSITPSEAMKYAYANLNVANTIEDVQRLFPDEERFIYLTTLKETPSRRGIIGIYKDFEEIFRNGILQSGLDFTVYLLRKLFVETKVYKEINDDLDNDLIPDIKDYFHKKYNSNEYVTTEVLRALEIYPADQDMRNSLKFTKDGYSDLVGLTISASLLRRLQNMSEEEIQEEVNNRSEGLKDWWNSKSYEEKLELALSVDVNDEGYKNYRKFANASRKRNREYLQTLPEFMTPEPKKKIKTNFKINDKDLYILWMQNNLKKFINSMTEEELLAFEVRRSAQQAQRWAEMSPEERTEYINKIRTGLEPFRYAMIDTWNHSRTLIRMLAEFLKEQQILKPIDLLYDTKEFSKFQSRIMNEFWSANRDAAIEFGQKLKYAHQRVENAIRNGNFEELKKTIDKEKEERILILAKEYQAEADVVKKAEEAKIKEKEASIPQDNISYRKDFVDIYKQSIDIFNLIPDAYIRGITEVMLDNLPKETIIKYGNALKNNEPLPQDIQDSLKEIAPKTDKLKRTLEAAIAVEMTSRGDSAKLFNLEIDDLISALHKKHSDDILSETKKINPKRIEKLFKEYNKDFADNELDILANKYFIPVDTTNGLTREQNDEFEEYLNTYGRSLLILFSDKSAFSDEVKINFNKKFLKLMPEKIKEYVHPSIKTHDDIIEENKISNMILNIYKRFRYIPDDILKIYTRELAYAIRLDRDTHEQNWLQNFTNIFSNKAYYGSGQIFPNIVKRLLSDDDKLKMIAIEQAMADEFYRVTKDPEAYTKSFEQLLNFYDMLSIMKKNEKINLSTEDDSVMFTVNEKPNTKYIFTKYLKYYKSLKENKNIIDSNNNVVIPEILSSLNPNEKNSFKNAFIEKRIMPYFMSDEEFMAKEDARIRASEYRKDFIYEFKKRQNKYNLLPSNYIRDMSNAILDTFPKEFIEKYTKALSTSNGKIPEDIIKTLADEGAKNNNIQLIRMQRALEAAIAAEMVNKGGSPLFFEMTTDSLIPVYEVRARNNKYKPLNTDVIQSLYNDFLKDLTKEELENIANRYFVSKDPNSSNMEKNDKILIDYINEFGKSALILFDEKNKLSSNIKNAFNNKFLKLMPQKVKDVAQPLLANSDDFELEDNLIQVKNKITRRFDFIPKKALDTYAQEVATAVRIYRQPQASEEDRKNFSLENIKKELCQRHLEDGGVIILRIHKDTLSKSSKLQLLAAEQAMADELYRVSGNNMVYKYELEDLATWYEMINDIKLLGSGLEITSAYGDSFKVKQKPNPKRVAMKFNEYMEEFSTRDDLYLENGKLDKETILYCLNPDENKPQKDDYIKERIDRYFVD